MRVTILACSAFLLLAGCGVECGEGTEEVNGKCVPASGELAQSVQSRCNLLCDRTDKEACTAEDAQRCLEACHTKMTGLSESCGVCLLDNSEGINSQCTEMIGSERSCSCCREEIQPVSSSSCTSFCTPG